MIDSDARRRNCRPQFPGFPPQVGRLRQHLNSCGVVVRGIGVQIVKDNTLYVETDSWDGIPDEFEGWRVRVIRNADEEIPNPRCIGG